MSTGPDNLFALAQALLDAGAKILADAGVEPPALRYVFGVGQPAATCDQMVVSWERIAVGTTGDTANVMVVPAYRRVMPRTAHLQLWCFRCLTNSLGVQGLELTENVNADQCNFDAEMVMTDAYLLARGIPAANSANEFGTWAESLAVGEAVPIEGRGQVGGCMLTLEAELS